MNEIMTTEQRAKVRKQLHTALLQCRSGIERAKVSAGVLAHHGDADLRLIEHQELLLDVAQRAQALSEILSKI